ncbi:MAG TPA: rRNA maturation RNase YbeY [Candidatus Paceibacterota bacterium]|jgi:probable rRNA maturation factor|nr:rRNA maturation RNase YbeY [Candidatus Paceibacterota bacterium]
MKGTLDVRNFTRRVAPGLPYAKIAAAILPGWEISLVFAGEMRAKNLNMQLRNKDYVPNVLSYETSATKKERSGEIIICPAVAKREAGDYGLSYSSFIGFLFIHGLLHLKGLPHGPTMDRYEREYLSRFTNVPSSNLPHGPTHRNRH